VKAVAANRSCCYLLSFSYNSDGALQQKKTRDRETEKKIWLCLWEERERDSSLSKAQGM
jgi:hypothetical protein